MRRISVDTLVPMPSLGRALYHESGALLFTAGERLAEDDIGLLRRSGIRRIYDVGADAEAVLPGEDSRTGPAELIEPAVAPPEVRTFRRERRSAAAARAIERAVRLPESRLILDPRGELRNGGVDRAIARSRTGQLPEGTPWSERLEDIRPESPRPAAEKAAALAARGGILERLRALFVALRAGDGVPGGAAFIGDLVRDVCALAVRDPDLAIALALAPSTPEELRTSSAQGERRGPEGARTSSAQGERGGGLAGATDGAHPVADLLARHSFDVAVLAIATAIELGYALEQIVEIAHAALLHDVGMVRLPESVALKPGALDEEERRELERHPLHAIEVLRRFPEVPVALVATALEEHERADGSGYPNNAPETGEFARIVAVADVFEALSAPRPHRPARPPHAAVRELVGLGAKKKLDTKVIRAFLKAVSIYPVGSYLRLSDGAVARVVRPGGPDASRPTVAVIDAAAGDSTAVSDARPLWRLLHLAARPDLRVAETDLPAGATGGLAHDDILVGF